jgi:hypothetical protein
VTGPNSGGVLLQAPPPKLDGGQEHILLLRTADGDEHYLAYNLNAPTKDGAADLGAVKAANAAHSGLQGIVQRIASAQVAAIAAALGQKSAASPVVEVEGDTIVVLAQVTSARYLGKLVRREPEQQAIVVEAPDGVKTRYRYDVEEGRS